MKTHLWQFVSLIVLLIIFIGGTGCTQSIEPRMFSTDSVYEVEITADQQLTNVTVFLPLPVYHGIPRFGNENLSPDEFEKSNFSAEFSSALLDPNLQGFFVPKDNSPMWVKLHTDRVFPNTSSAVYSIYLSNRSAIEPAYFPDTVFPLSTQSAFLPKINFSFSEPVIAPSEYQHWITYHPVVIEEKVPIFADYNTSNETRVEISFSTGAGNSWKEDYDNYRGNGYSDKLYWTNYGSAYGWQVAQGEFRAADGEYPNLSSPVWQTVIRANVTGR